MAACSTCDRSPGSAIIDIHTHCSPPRPPGDRFGVQEALRGTPAGKNTVTNYRGLPAVAYHEMGDFELQKETCRSGGARRRPWRISVSIGPPGR
jgi:hypothetical protein